MTYIVCQVSANQKVSRGVKSVGLSNIILMVSVKLPLRSVMSEAHTALGSTRSPATVSPASHDLKDGFSLAVARTSLLLLPEVFVISDTTTSRW